MDWCEKEDKAVWYEILEMIEPSVEKLSIVLDGCKKVPVDPRWEFPELTSLNCLGSQLMYFVRCTTLVKLKWSESRPGRDPRLLTILSNNSNLKEISAPAHDFASHQYEFKLKKYTIKSDPKITLNKRKLCLFLENQSESLESLEIKAKLNQPCLELILSSMPRLKSLSIDFFWVQITILNWRLGFPVNTSVESLELNYLRRDPNQMSFDTLIRGLTNLKHLKCSKITDSDIIFLSREVPALESLETKNFNVTNLPTGNIFPNMRIFRADCFNEDMEVPLSEDNFATLISKEMMKYFQRKFVIDN